MDKSAVLEQRVAELEAEILALKSDRARQASAHSDASGEGAMLKALLDSFDKRRGVEQALESSQEWLHLAQLVGGVAFYSLDIAAMRNDWSHSTMAMYGFEDGSGISFERWVDAIHPDDRDKVMKVVEATTIRGEDVDQVFRIVRPDGEVRHILDRGRLFRDAAGPPARLIGINIDITDQRQLEDELRFSNDFLRSVLSASEDCVKVIGLDGALIYMSENGQKAMEVDDFSAIEGACWAGLWPSEMRARLDQAVGDAVLGRKSRFEGYCPTAKGTPRHWDVTVSPIHDSDGKVIRIVSVSRDITHEVAARDRAQLINRELHHRIKNSIATAQALARSTLRQSTSLADFEATFDARLSSLADVHALLGKGDDTADMEAIVTRQLAPYGGTMPIRIAGPAVCLSQERAVALAMIIHELTTNACKYGGLSEQGRGIDIEWRIEDGDDARLHFVWQEKPPLTLGGGVGGGFGSRLIKGLVASDLRGRIEAGMSADGYRVAIDWPLR